MKKLLRNGSLLLLAVALTVALIPRSHALEISPRKIPVKVDGNRNEFASTTPTPVPVDNQNASNTANNPKATETAGLSARDILAKVDANHKYQTSYSESRMEITIGSRKVTKSLRSWTEGGVEKAFAEFLDKRDQSRMLKLKDDLWLFSPTAESEVKLSGDMLDQGMGGSDFSYRDMLENLHLLDLYNVNLSGEETIGGRPCYILELTARNGVEVSYFRRKMWVDKERFIQLKEEMYAPSGKLLKVSTVEKVDQFGCRYYPTVSLMEDKIRKNSNTRMMIDKIQFDIAIPPGTFTRQHLTAR